MWILNLYDFLLWLRLYKTFDWVANAGDIKTQLRPNIFTIFFSKRLLTFISQC